MDAGTPSPVTRTSAAVRAYAARCREVLPEGFAARSYAGLWLLLATLGPATVGRGREDLEDALGIPVDEAIDLADRLVAEQHGAVDAAVAGWLRPGVSLPEALPVHLDALPDRIVVLDELPRSGRGRKLDRDRLRELVGAGGR